MGEKEMTKEREFKSLEEFKKAYQLEEEEEEEIDPEEFGKKLAEKAIEELKRLIKKGEQ